MTAGIQIRAPDFAAISICLADTKLMEEAARGHLARSRRRVETLGLGPGENPLPKYSAKYAAFRSSKGRGIDHRSLSFTGQMLTGRHLLKVTPTTALIGWTPGPLAERASGNETRTPFLDATPAERASLVMFMKHRIVECMKTRLRTQAGGLAR